MKFILIVLFMTFAQFSFTQVNNQENTFFAQGMFQQDDEVVIRDLETEIRALSFIKIVRLDTYSNRFFILTKDIDQLDETTLRSWFSDKGSGLSCIQIGVYGVDAINTFPFVNCQN